MSLLELIAIVFILCWLVYIVLWAVLDCNVELWFKERFGQPISRLRGQVVWITGASSGIGEALALTLAKHGVRLVLSARREPLLLDVREKCLAQSGGLLSPKDVLVLPMDMLELNSHQSKFGKVIEHFGSLDILVNNAGRSQRANWEDISVQVDRDLFELDVFSVMHLNRIAVKYFLQQNGGRGHLAVTSSIVGLFAWPYSATYCAAKHSVGAYMETLKLEQPTLEVTVFAPGPIATNFLEEAFTAQPGSKVGSTTINNKKRMTAERCGQLFAVALANKNVLAWCGKFPVVLLAYISQYPFLAKIMNKNMSQETMTRIREGKL